MRRVNCFCSLPLSVSLLSLCLSLCLAISQQVHFLHAVDLVQCLTVVAEGADAETGFTCLLNVMIPLFVQFPLPV